MWLETIFFLENVVFGSPLLFAVMFTVVLAMLLLLAKTSLRSILTFMVLPLFAFTQSGRLDGVVSGSAYILSVLILGILLFQSIKKLGE